jgi:hypothetical protein
MYSFQSKSNWIIFIPLRVKARLCIEFTFKFYMNESLPEKICYSRIQNALYAVARNKIRYVVIKINV